MYNHFSNLQKPIVAAMFEADFITVFCGRLAADLKKFSSMAKASQTMNHLGGPYLKNLGF